MSRKKIIFLASFTLIIFPLPVFIFFHYFESKNILDLLQLNTFGIVQIGYGLQFGFVYAFFANLLLKSTLFDKLPLKIDEIIKSMNLSYLDALYISFCAGFGEEILFRVGIQHYLGVILTSIFFVAIHGYLNPFNWRFSIYGLIVLPFILILSYGYEYFGLWFAIAAHFSYDAVLLIAQVKKKPKTN